MMEKNDLLKILNAKSANKSSRTGAINSIDSADWKSVETLKSVMKDTMKKEEDGEKTLELFSKLDEINDARMVDYFIDVLEDREAQEVYRKMALNSILRLRQQGKIENKKSEHGDMDFSVFQLNSNYPVSGENKITESELKKIENAIYNLLSSERADDEMKDLIQRHKGNYE